MPQNFDNVKQQYLNKLALRGIELDGDQLTKLNTYISNQKSQDMGLTKKTFSAPLISAPSGNTTKRAPLGQAVHGTPERDSSLLKTLGVGLWYGLESYLWESPGFVLKQMGIDEPFQWDTLTGSEKAAAVGAGGGALFLPGPGGFRGAAKLLSFGASRVAKKGAVKGINKAADEVLSSQRILNRAGKLYPEGHKNLTKAGSLRKNTQIAKQLQASGQSVQRELVNEAKKRIPSLAGVRAGLEGAEQATKNFNQASVNAVIRALQDSGVKMGPSRMRGLADEIAGRFTDKVMKNGYNVNNIAEWGHEVFGRAFGGKINDTIAKYLGMAVQDIALLGVHGAVSSKLQSSTHDMPWDAGHVAWNTVYMSALFPAIRGLVPGFRGKTGNMSIKQGWGLLLSKFKNTNYQKMADGLGANAEGSMRHLMKQMLNGTHKDIVNRSALKDQVFKGKTGEQLLNEVDNMPLDDVINYLGLMRKNIISDASKKWRWDYISDFMGSSPRMIVGAMAMNAPSWKNGEFQHMEPLELYTHMIMAGLMTKSKGEWGKKEAMQYQMDMGRYHEVLRTLDIDPTHLEGMFIFDKAMEDVSKVISGPDAKKIIEIFDNVKGEQADLLKGKKGKGVQVDLNAFNSHTHKIVAELATLYNSHVKASGIKGEKDVLDVRSLSEEQLTTIKDKLEAIELDGETIKNLGFQGTKAKLSELMGEHVKQVYIGMFKELNDLNIPFEVITGRDGKETIQAGVINFGDEASVNGTINSLHTTIELLKREGIASTSNKTFDGKNIDKVGNDKVGWGENGGLQAVQDVIKKYESILVRSFYPGSNQMLTSYDGEPSINNNVFLDAMISSQQWKRANRLYDFIVGKSSSKETAAAIADFSAGWETLFNRNGLFPLNWDKQVVFDSADKKKALKEEGKEAPTSEAEENFNVMKQSMRELWEMRSQTTRNPERHTETVKVTEDDMKKIYNAYGEVFGDKPSEMSINGVGRLGVDYFMKRYLDNVDLPVETAQLFKDGMKIGFVVPNRDGTFFVMSDRVIEKMMTEQGIEQNSSEWNARLKEAQEIRKEMKAVDNVVEESYLLESTEVLPDGKELRMPTLNEIRTLYESRDTKHLKNLNAEIIAAVDKIGTGVSVGIEKEIARISDVLSQNFNIDVPLGDRLETIVQVRDKLTDLIKSYTEETSGEPTDASKLLIKEFRSLRKDLNKKVREMNTEGYEETSDGLNTYVTTVRERLLQGSMGEIHQKAEFRKALNILMGYSEDGAVGAQAIISAKREAKLALMEFAGMKDSESKHTLADVLQAFADKPGVSWQHLEKARTQMEAQLNLQKNISNKGLFEEAVNRLRTTLDQHQRRDDIKTAIQIGQEYDLMSKDNPNQLDAELIRDIADHSNPGDRMDAILRERLGTGKEFDNLSPWKKKQAINDKVREFQERDGLTLLHYAINSREIRSARFVDGDLIFEPTDSRFTSPTVEFLRQFEGWYLNNSGQLPRLVEKGKESGLYGRPRRSSVNIWSRENDLNKYIVDLMEGKVEGAKISNTYLEHKLYEELLPTDKDTPAPDPKLAALGMPGKGENPFFIKVGTENFLFENNKPNHIILNSMFRDWYDTSSKSLKGTQKESFKKMWDDVLNGGDTPRTTELKMSALFIDSNMKQGWIKDYLNPDIFKNTSERQLWESKIHQRAALANGGTSQAMNEKVFNYMIKRTKTWGNLKKDLTHYKNNKVNYGVFRDEAKLGDGSWNRQSPFHVGSLVKRTLQAMENNPNVSKAQKALAKNMRLELQRDAERRENGQDTFYPSLDASSIDGVKYIGTRFMKVLAAVKGRDPNEFNGIKPYTFYNESDGTMMAKGYYVYDPTVAAKMDNSKIDVLLGESSAKLMGNVEPLQIGGNTNDWIGQINKLGVKNQIGVDISSIGLGVVNVEKSASSRSHSIGDYQSRGYHEELRVWQGLEDMIDKVSYFDKSRNDGNAALAQIFFEAKRQEGMRYTEGAISLSERLIEVGMTSDNPIIRHTLRRFMQGPLLDLLRKMNNENSLDAMIAPDMNGELRIPNFAKVIEGKEIVDRVQTNIGETDLPFDMAGKLINNFSDITFVFNNGGVDNLIGKDGKIEKNRAFGKTLAMRKEDSNGRVMENDYDPYTVKENVKRNQDALKVYTRLRELWEGVDKKGKPLPKRERMNGPKTYGELQKWVEVIAGRSTDAGFIKKVGHMLFKKAGVSSNLFKKADFGLTIEGYPIPRVGYDLATLRVSKMGEKTADHTDGKIVRINSYDQRVGFQRDNDGDRFYLNFDRGIDIMANNMKNFAKVTDYRQMPKESPVINLFGLDENFVAGATQKFGMGDYMGQYEQQKMNVGSAIGIKSALTHLSNAQMSIKLYVGKDRHGNSKYTTFNMLDIANTPYAEGNSPASRKFNAVMRQFIFNQSSVDVNKGTNAIAKEGREALLNAMLFGDRPTDVELSHYLVGKDNSLFWSKGGDTPAAHWGLASREVIKEALKMVREGSKLFNDVYDEGGSRQPTDKEMRKAYGDLQSLFGDTREMNRVLFDRVFKKALAANGGKGNKDLALDTIHLFFGKGQLPGLKEVLNKTGKDKQKILQNLGELFREGLPKNFNVDPIINFNYTKQNSTTVQADRIDLGQAGYILRRLNNKSFLNPRDEVWGNVPREWRRQVGDFADRMVSSIETLALINGHLSTTSIVERITNGDLDTMLEFESVLDSRIDVSVSKAQKRGAVAAALNSELQALKSLDRWYQGERYAPNSEKLLALERRIGSTQKALNYIKDKAWDSIAVDPKAYKHRKSIKSGNGTAVRTNNDKYNLYVWKYRGTADRIADMDSKKLQFVGNIKPKWSYYQKDDGYSYIELRNPLMPTDMTHSDLRHSFGLMAITAHVTAKDIVRGKDNQAFSELDFVDKSEMLISGLNAEGFQANQLVNQNRARRKEIYTRAKTKSQRLIDAHMREWAFDGKAFDQDMVEQVVKYLITPRSVEGFTTVNVEGGKRIDFPTFKINRRLFTELFEWMDNNGMGYVSEGDKGLTGRIVEEWNASSRGEGAEFEMDRKMYNKGFSTDYNALSTEDANMAGTLVGYTDPMIRKFFDNQGMIVPTSRVEYQNAEGARGFIRFLKRGTIEKPWCKGG